MKALTPSEHKALASLAPTREVYGKAPLPIEILAAGGPKALREWLSLCPDGHAKSERSSDASVDPVLWASAQSGERKSAEDYRRSGLGTPPFASPLLREWLRKGTA